MDYRNTHRDPIVSRLAAHGARPALCGRAGEITYMDLARRTIDRVAALGTGRRLVMVEGVSDPETIVTLLACRAAGHAAWLVPHGVVDDGPAARGAFPPDTVASGGRVVFHAATPRHVLHPQLALLMGTSGSTGGARLVRLSRHNLDSNASAIARYLQLTQRDVGVTALPLSYCYGLSVVTSHLAVGAAVLVTDRSITDPAFWAEVDACGVTGIPGVPHTYELLDRVGGTERLPASVRYLTQAGGRLDPGHVARYAAGMRRRGGELFVMYGQTEATARMAYLPPDLAERHPATVGVAIPGGELTIDAPDPDGPGELIYRGPNVMMGYAEAPEDLARGPLTDVLRTGDLARRTPAGLIEIVGRCARIVKPFGVRIDLDDTERVLAEMGVSATCAGDDERLCVATTDAGRVDEVRVALARRLRLPTRVVHVHAWDALPRLGNGKPDYRAVAAQPAPADAAPACGRTTPDCPVTAAFRDVLDVAVVRPGDTFVDLGGDSLSYVEMSIALEELVGPPPPDWPTMTVAELRGLCSACAVAPARGRRVRRLETSLVLRAAAIVMIVAGHMRNFMPQGGAHVLLALVGVSFARFQMNVADLGLRLRRGLSMVGRIAVPTVAWVGAQMLLAGGYGLGTLLLVNNYVGSDAHTADKRWVFWFIEVLVHVMLVLVPLMCVPAVARLQRRLPFALPFTLAAVGLAAGLATRAAGEPNYMLVTHAAAWFIFLGWAIHAAGDVARRLAVTALGVAGALAYFTEPDRRLLVTAALVLLIWVPSIPIPDRIVAWVGAVASASLAIYITHWVVWPTLDSALPFVPAWALTVAAGVGAWWVWTRVTGAGRVMWPARRRPAPFTAS